MLLTEVLDELGFQTVTAGDGVAMLELVDRHRPALIVVDIMMPLMDGYSAIARLRGQRATADVPIVVITGRTDPVYRALSEGVGVAAHLTKPFSPKELVEVVQRLVPGTRA